MKTSADSDRLRESGERIERLLEELRAMASPAAWKHVEELMRLVVDLYGKGLGRVLEVLGKEGEAGSRVGERLAQDELVSSLLILHNLHPESLTRRVEKALERVRPYLGSHGGDIEIADVDEAAGAVLLRMKGSCDGCPSSIHTIRLAVEGAIREAAPEVMTIDVEGLPMEAVAPSAGHGNGHGHAHGPAGGNGLLQIGSAFPSPARSPGADDAFDRAGAVFEGASSRPESPMWVPLGALNGIGAGRPDVREVAGSRIVVCRVDGRFYAYRDGCPACGSEMTAAIMDGTTLTCPACARRYDVRLAGRAADGGTDHMVPVPLLENESGVSVALPAARA